MEFIIMFMIILINAILYTIKLRNKIETNIPLAVVSMILMVYVFGLIDKLIYGIWAIVITTVIELIYEIIFFIKNKGKLKEILFVPSVFVYFILGLVFIKFNEGLLFVEYDEFSHWGLIVKNMFEFGNFGISSIIEYTEYPPFVSIFQYMLVAFKKVYSEDVVIIGLNLLYLSFMIPLLRNIKWDKSLLKLLILIPIILIIPIIFYEDFYFTLFVDGFLGVLFAYTIYSWYINEGKERNFSIIFGSIGLILTKSIGIYLAIAAIIIFSIDTIIAKIKKLPNVKSNLKIIMILLILIIGISAIWQIKINEASKNWNVENVTLENIVKVFKGEGKYYQKTVIKLFTEESFYSRGSLTSRNMNIINVFGLLIIFDLIVISRRGKRFIAMSVELIVFWCIYIVAQLFMYLFVFTQEEALILACFQRYILIIPFANVLINLFLINDYYKDEKIDSKNIVIILALIVMFLPIDIIKKIYLENAENKAERIEYRDGFKISIDYENEIDKEDKVYYINNFTDNREILIVKYDFLPYQIANKSSKLNMSLDEFKNILIEESYDYIYVRITDRILENKFKELFENGLIEDNTLYEVIKENDNIMFSRVK